MLFAATGRRFAGVPCWPVSVGSIFTMQRRAPLEKRRTADHKNSGRGLS